jgi:hypothetical protein
VRLETVRRLADDFDVGVGTEQGAEAGANEELIVDYDDRDWHGVIIAAVLSVDV